MSNHGGGMTYFKVLNADGTVYHGGQGAWGLPKGKRPGKWMKVTGPIVPCHNGLHLCRPKDLLNWFGPAIFVAEARGDVVVADNKAVVSEARLLHRTPWNDRVARLFAADCAERVLPIFEKERPGDDRPRKAIVAARLFANGEIDASASAAAGADARDAARAAAGDAAGDAAGADARDAAWAAAGAAARDAAGDAASAAARDAARAAASAAASAAAGDAAREWQTNRLIAYLNGEVT